MDKRIQESRSVRKKLFVSLCVVIIVTIFFLIIINNIVLETFYIYNKKDSVKAIYEELNEKYNNEVSDEEIKEFVKEQSSKNNLDIFIKNPYTEHIVTNSQNKLDVIDKLKNTVNFSDNGKQI